MSSRGIHAPAAAIPARRFNSRDFKFPAVIPAHTGIPAMLTDGGWCQSAALADGCHGDLVDGQPVCDEAGGHWEDFVVGALAEMVEGVSVSGCWAAAAAYCWGGLPLLGIGGTAGARTPDRREGFRHNRISLRRPMVLALWCWHWRCWVWTTMRNAVPFVSVKFTSLSLRPGRSFRVAQFPPPVYWQVLTLGSHRGNARIGN